MKRYTYLSLIALTIWLFAVATAVSAQSNQNEGTIRGGVYRDVNNDGRCVDTGVVGESGIPGIEVQFVSSDRATVVTLTTGDDGTFGLAAAGQSVWEVTARPNPSQWIVTSENPRYVPVLPESGLVQTGVNFCIGQGSNAVIVLPESGGRLAHSWAVLATAVGGLAIFATGMALEWRRRLS